MSVAGMHFPSGASKALEIKIHAKARRPHPEEGVKPNPALAEFALLLEGHPEYTAGYFMAAQTLVRAERVEDAKRMLQDGIASARRTGNLHAQSEMEAMLGELG